MLNYSSPIVQQTLMNAGYYNNQPQQNVQINYNIGQQGYNGNYQPMSNFNNGIQPNYNYNNGYYNPLLMQQEQDEYIKKQREQISYTRKLERNLHLNSYIVRGIEVTEEIEKMLDDLYLPEWDKETKSTTYERPKAYRFSEQVTVVAYKGDVEVYNSKRDSRKLDIGPNFEEEGRGYSYYGNPYIGKSVVDRAIDAMKHQEMYPNGEPAMIAAWNKIREENDALISPDCNMVEFFANAYKLYIRGIIEKGRKQETKLNRLYDSRRFHKSLGSGVNLDDQVVGLPDHLKTEYMARKRAFIAAAMARGGEANG